MQVVQRKIFYLFSPFLRIFHWIMVDAIIVMFVTGILIAKPPEINAIEPAQSLLLIDIIRKIHFLAAFGFCASIIFRIYGFIINKGDRLFPRFWEGHFYAETIDVALHYMLLKKSHKSYLRNPLARMSYFALYVLVAIEILTGFAMYNMTEPNAIGGVLFGWVNTVLGGEMMTHIVHHFVAWAIVLFASGHLYMVTRAEFMEGESEVSSMFAGSKILTHDPIDANELE
ncbi:MAG: Ni/Fe-hydrogenase, b-type cytochrome subunit [Schwartzia sp.]|nr:Ni/Fe-hydrogenase, b-type cytochrome subunit [Schwartzia sp. (in: firmicutes)]